jgi:hypothetical protein
MRGRGQQMMRRKVSCSELQCDMMPLLCWIEGQCCVRVDVMAE